MKKRNRIIVNTAHSLGMGKILDRVRFRKEPEKPKRVFIEVTNACNLKCKMCDRKNLTRKIGFMDMGMFKSIVEDEFIKGIPNIRLNNFGEPLLHPDLVEMTTYLKTRGYQKIGFATNGLLLNREKSEGFINGGLDYIIFSVEGTTQQTYEAIRIGGKFEKIRENIKLFHKLREESGGKKPEILMNSLLMTDTKDEVNELEGFWGPYVDNIKVIPCSIYGEIDAASHKDVRAAYPHSCKQLWENMAILWNGEVSTCCIDLNGSLKIGDINNGSISTTWNSALQQKYREIHLTHQFHNLKACKNCDGIWV